MKKLTRKILCFFSDKYIDNVAIIELNKISQMRWDWIRSELNKWQIPEELNHIKPDWWDEEASKELGQKKYEFLKPIMKHIDTKIGRESFY